MHIRGPLFLFGAGLMTIGGGLIGYQVGRDAVLRVEVADPASLVGPDHLAVHDAAFTGPGAVGVLALGVVGTHYPRVGSDGDMAILRIDRESGAVLARCLE